MPNVYFQSWNLCHRHERFPHIRYSKLRKEIFNEILRRLKAICLNYDTINTSSRNPAPHSDFFRRSSRSKLFFIANCCGANLLPIKIHKSDDYNLIKHEFLFNIFYIIEMVEISGGVEQVSKKIFSFKSEDIWMRMKKKKNNQRKMENYVRHEKKLEWNLISRFFLVIFQLIYVFNLRICCCRL